MKISGAWMGHSGTKSVCRTLAEAGFTALFVGGCVRNAILGVPIGDIDIATDALPDTVTRLAQDAGLKVIPTGIEHGTVTVVADGRPHEVTTFRRDVGTDGRWAVVAFSADIAEDARRRDFTMNALYADQDGLVIDPLGGLADLVARRVRFVGQAEQRIREDFLRILRFFRFHAQYGDPGAGLDAEGLAACAGLADGLESLSRERVGGEMRKLLSAADPAPSVAAMAQSGILARILPGADQIGLAPLIHLENGVAPRWQRRLAVLGGDDPVDRLRLSRAEARELRLVRTAIGSLSSAAALGWKLGPAAATDVVLARAALFQAQPQPGWAAEIEWGHSAQFPVSAVDLTPELEGPALGKRLRELEDRWLLSDLRLAKGDLIG